MNAAPAPDLTETLANLSVAWILVIIAGLTLARLFLVRVPAPAARSMMEMLESAIVAVALVFLIIRPFIVQAFFIPSPSMEPTLLGNNNVGDHILVNKFEYRLQMPHHDDVAVFLAPPEAMAGNPDFIKRLIGAPKDRIQVISGQITINGIVYHHYDVRKALAAAGELGTELQQEAQNNAPSLDSDIQTEYHAKFVANGVRVTDNFGNSRLVPAAQLAQMMTGFSTYTATVRPGVVIRNGQILVEPFAAEDPDYDMTIYNGEPLKHDFNPDDPTPYRGAVDGEEQQISPNQYALWSKQPNEPITANHYLMMGDNRNDSDDSTNWGLLEKYRIVGKAQFIFWPLSRIGIIH